MISSHSHVNVILCFVTSATSLHDIRLCDHVNTREEQNQELMKMEKTQQALLLLQGFLSKLLTAGACMWSLSQAGLHEIVSFSKCYRENVE